VAEFTDEIMYRIAAMLPPEYQGVYAPTPSPSRPPSIPPNPSTPLRAGSGGGSRREEPKVPRSQGLS